jgi:hypothetical protein
MKSGKFKSFENQECIAYQKLTWDDGSHEIPEKT